MRGVLFASAWSLAGCAGVFGLTPLPPDGGESGGDGGGSVTPSDGGFVSPACTPHSFDSAAAVSSDKVLGNGMNEDGLTISDDGLTFVVEDSHVLYRRDVNADTNLALPSPTSTATDEVADPEIDPEGQILYARDSTTLLLVGYSKGPTGFALDTSLAVPVGHRAGTQTFDLGGFRRMMVRDDAMLLQEQEGTPRTAWTLRGPTYQPTDLVPGATELDDPALTPDGLNLVFVVRSGTGQTSGLGAYVVHRDSVSARFMGPATLIHAADVSTPQVSQNCLYLYWVDKKNHTGHRRYAP